MLGLNKIYQGDCIKLMKKMKDNSVDLVLTDPPWNMKKDYGEYKDNLTTEEYIDFVKILKGEWNRVSREGKYAIVLGSKILKLWWDIFPEAKLIIIRVGAIVKSEQNNFHLQWKGVLTNCVSNRWQPDLWEDIRWPGEGYFYNEPRYGHPAMTPLKLMVRCLDLFTEKNAIILDTFMGVGTTAHACKAKKRNFIGFEMNPEYIKIAEERIKKVQLELF